MRRDVSAFEHEYANMFLSVCTSELSPLNFRLFGHLIKKILWFRGISASDASLYKQFTASTKVAYRHTTKRLSTRIDEMVPGPNQRKNNALWETSAGKKGFHMCF